MQPAVPGWDTKGLYAHKGTHYIPREKSANAVKNFPNANDEYVRPAHHVLYRQPKGETINQVYSYSRELSFATNFMREKRRNEGKGGAKNTHTRSQK